MEQIEISKAMYLRVGKNQANANGAVSAAQNAAVIAQTLRATAEQLIEAADGLVEVLADGPVGKWETSERDGKFILSFEKKQQLPAAGPQLVPAPAAPAAESGLLDGGAAS